MSSGPNPNNWVNPEKRGYIEQLKFFLKPLLFKKNVRLFNLYKAYFLKPLHSLRKIIIIIKRTYMHTDILIERLQVNFSDAEFKHTLRIIQI